MHVGNPNEVLKNATSSRNIPRAPLLSLFLPDLPGKLSLLNNTALLFPQKQQIDFIAKYGHGSRTERKRNACVQIRSDVRRSTLRLRRRENVPTVTTASSWVYAVSRIPQKQMDRDIHGMIIDVGECLFLIETMHSFSCMQMKET